MYLRIVKNRAGTERLNRGEGGSREGGGDLSGDFKILIELDENICILIWVSAGWVITVHVEQHYGNERVSKNGQAAGSIQQFHPGDFVHV